MNGPRPLAKRSTSWRSAVGAAGEKHVGQAGRRHCSKGIAVAAGILGGDQPLLAGDPHDDRAPFLHERRGEGRVVLAGAQVAAHSKLVVQAVGRRGRAAQLAFHFVDGVGVEQLAELLLPE